MTRTAIMTPFGIVTIVFFRCSTTTGLPIYSDPQVWTYDAGDCRQAWADLERLKQMDHVHVPQDELAISTHKSC